MNCWGVENLDCCCIFIARKGEYWHYGVGVVVAGCDEDEATVVVADAGWVSVAGGVEVETNVGVPGPGVPAVGVTLAWEVGVATNGGLVNMPNIASMLSLFTISGAPWFKRA